ncbi:hypothetical protein IW262DRAFT_1110451 [Armillaria fumosa]|nr:hypothetical protein IW262DRAFT_1110451 [Armillaria fumosa]
MIRKWARCSGFIRVGRWPGPGTSRGMPWTSSLVLPLTWAVTQSILDDERLEPDKCSHLGVHCSRDRICPVFQDLPGRNVGLLGLFCWTVEEMGWYRLGTETTVDLYCADEFEKISHSSVVVNSKVARHRSIRGGRWGSIWDHSRDFARNGPGGILKMVALFEVV